ncbi:MAG: 4-oxalocrotonate tautomerase [Bryobacterales bacterium]|nr:4-oxalocrotonate tautomerase [Bryobacterales bacterium]
MPHVIVKLWPGKSERQKKELSRRITGAVIEVLNYGEDSVSVAFEEVSSDDWATKVYLPDIVNGTGKLYKTPGYTM